MHDNPGLAEAVRTHEHVVPLFVLDDVLLRRHGTARRRAFLADCLTDLRESLRRRGADLVVRRGEAVAETVRVAHAHDASTVFVAADSSAYAQRRQRGLERERLDVHAHSAVAVVEPGAIVPDGRDHYRVFTPYWRRWRAEPLRAVLDPPERLSLPDGIATGDPPRPGNVDGGEQKARGALDRWLRSGLDNYEHLRDIPAADATSRLSAYLHFGCLSAAEVATRARSSEEFVRQLCWRDFFLQLLAAQPQLETEDLYPRRDEWRDDPAALERWRNGETGVPIVDAAMRQLDAEGWIPNRARLIVGGFLTRTLGLDWRLGAAVFSELLLDADVASNTGNWQWVAGTGVDTRPRGFNAATQAKRFDADGEYVRSHLRA